MSGAVELFPAVDSRGHVEIAMAEDLYRRFTVTVVAGGQRIPIGNSPFHSEAVAKAERARFRYAVREIVDLTGGAAPDVE